MKNAIAKTCTSHDELINDTALHSVGNGEPLVRQRFKELTSYADGTLAQATVTPSAADVTSIELSLNR